MAGQDLAPLLSLSPLDGRYANKTKVLREYFSEKALIKYRVIIEVEYLLVLVEFLRVYPAKLRRGARRLLAWAKDLTDKDVVRVKQIEKKINHDVKAVEYLVREKLEKLGLEQFLPFVHWGLTSEDVNNLAYGLMINKAIRQVLVPKQVELVKSLLTRGERYSSTVMPGRTHGQLAVPTTFGKELVVFASRAEFFLTKISQAKLGGKLNGAVGNFNAQVQIYPEKDWLEFSQQFIKKLGLEPTSLTTQIEPGTRLVESLDWWRQINNVWLDMAKDMWQYIAFDYLGQKVKRGEVGSSTMPHKVNPIDFENAEGNLELANSLLVFLSNKLAVSRMQRDLSDSTVKRNIGVAFGHMLVALESLIKGFDKVIPNTSLMLDEIRGHPEMLSEALQLWLKLKGETKAYDRIKLKTRGKKTTFKEMIEDLDVELKKELKTWRVEKYVGLVEKLAKKEINRIKTSLKEIG